MQPQTTPHEQKLALADELGRAAALQKFAHEQLQGVPELQLAVLQRGPTPLHRYLLELTQAN